MGISKYCLLVKRIRSQCQFGEQFLSLRRKLHHFAVRAIDDEILEIALEQDHVSNTLARATRELAAIPSNGRGRVMTLSHRSLYRRKHPLHVSGNVFRFPNYGFHLVHGVKGRLKVHFYVGGSNAIQNDRVLQRPIVDTHTGLDERRSHLITRNIGRIRKAQITDVEFASLLRLVCVLAIHVRPVAHHFKDAGSLCGHTQEISLQSHRDA